MLCVLNNTIKMVFVYRPHYAKTDLGRQSLKINKNKKKSVYLLFLCTFTIFNSKILILQRKLREKFKNKKNYIFLYLFGE